MVDDVRVVDFDACYLCFGAGGYEDFDGVWNTCSACEGTSGTPVVAEGPLQQDGTL